MLRSLVRLALILASLGEIRPSDLKLDPNEIPDVNTTNKVLFHSSNKEENNTDQDSNGLLLVAASPNLRKAQYDWIHGADAPVPCGSACGNDSQCYGGLNGCTACIYFQCRALPHPKCESSCTSNDQCYGAETGCTTCSNWKCVSNESFLMPHVYCGSTCGNGDECKGAPNGCTFCVFGRCIRHTSA